LEKLEKLKNLLNAEKDIYIYIHDKKTLWVDCYGLEAKLVKDGTVGTIMTGIDRSRNHYLIMEKNKSNLVGGVGSKGSTNQFRTQNRIYSSSSSVSLNTAFNPYIEFELAIRKPTPLECARLMNIKTEDYALISEHLTNAELYHIFGDSICSNVLMAIFSQMLDINWVDKFKEIENTYIKEK